MKLDLTVSLNIRFLYVPVKQNLVKYFLDCVGKIT